MSANITELMGNPPAYEKKDIIFSSTMGLCVVSDITKLSADKNTVPVPYYVLKSYYDKTHVAYIPVENHEVELRRPVDPDTAADMFKELKESYKEDPDFIPDELMIGELAYIMKLKPDALKELAGAPVPDEEA